MSTPDDSEPSAEFVGYMRQLYELERAGERTTLAIGPATAMVLIGVVQWATRNPSMPGTQRQILRGIVNQLRPLFVGTPGEELVNRGDHPEWDMPQS